MAHLLMIESWVGGTGRLLPAAITRLGHQYTFITRNRKHYLDERTRQIHPVLEHAQNVLTAETNNIPELIRFLKKQHKLLAFDGVITICDYYIDAVAQVAQALKLPQAFSTNVVAERCKHKVRQALQRTGLQNPAYQKTTSWQATRRAAEEIGYPLVLKPADLASSAFVRLVKNEPELHEAFTALEQFSENFREQKRAPLWLLEEYMEGDEFSVEACTFEGETTIIGITDKSLTAFPHFVEDGHMFPASLPAGQIEAIHTFTRQVLKAVGHDHGISHIEIKLTPQGPRLIEINPRPGGNYIPELIQHTTGIDFLAAQIDLALGRRPNLTVQDTGVVSAAIKFVVPPHKGRIQTIQGLDTLAEDAHIHRWDIPTQEGVDVAQPIDNACYLGYALTLDRHGYQARQYAEQAVGRLQLVYSPTQ